MRFGCFFVSYRNRPLLDYITGKVTHLGLVPKFEVKTDNLWIDAITMKDYGLTPTQWYALPRTDRLMMAATRHAERLLTAMQQYDYNEYHKQEAERNRKKRR